MSVRLVVALFCALFCVNSVAAEPALVTHRVELGVFGGIMLPPDEHELYQVNEVVQRSLQDVGPEVGFRLSYLPIRYLGIEAEGAFVFTSTIDDQSVLVYAARGHALAQYPWIVTPFLVIGGGALGVSSAQDALGDDVDGAFHWGGGAKYDITDWLVARLDIRHTVSGRLYNGGQANFVEILGGLSYVLTEQKPPPDSDGDGVPDKDDHCPQDPGPGRDDGCPDSDGDGIRDRDDQCPNDAAPGRPDGCPDRDGDGFPDVSDKCSDRPGEFEGCPPDSDQDGLLDPDDKCPLEAGPAPTGCPPKDQDTDKDGILDAQDKCPDKPETVNGYQDKDGCPDVLPERVKQFTGAIRGITFALAKATIRPKSFATLDEAAKVLQDHPTLRVQIRGHSDSSGKAAFNQQLSLKRAEAVKTYLVGKGIAAERLTSEGVGPAEPVATNKTAAGRAQNRRIEFKLLTK